jgi:hypothetical protein
MPLVRIDAIEDSRLEWTTLDRVPLSLVASCHFVRTAFWISQVPPLE